MLWSERYVWLQVEHGSLKSFEEWNFLRRIVLSLKDIELGLKTLTKSFPSIKRQSVSIWEYACLSRKTVEGRFLEGKLLKKLEILFIPEENSNMVDPTLMTAFIQGQVA